MRRGLLLRPEPPELSLPDAPELLPPVLTERACLHSSRAGPLPSPTGPLQTTTRLKPVLQASSLPDPCSTPSAASCPAKFLSIRIKPLPVLPCQRLRPYTSTWSSQAVPRNWPAIPQSA